MTPDDRFEDDRDAITVLSHAKHFALAEVIAAPSFRHVEAYRWAANARDHVSRAFRAQLGLDPRSDPDPGPVVQYPR